MKFLAACFTFLMLFNLPTRADGGVGPTYDVNGTMTVPGNPACGGTCAETVNFSFTAVFESFSSGLEGYSFLATSPISFTASGPITFDETFFSPFEPYVQFINSSTGDELDFLTTATYNLDTQ